MYLLIGAIAAGAAVIMASRKDAPPKPPAVPSQTATAPPSAATAPASAAAALASAATSAAPPEAPAPPASDAAPAVEPPPDEATRAALVGAVKAKQWSEATDALLELAAHDPTALRDAKVAGAANRLAVVVAQPEDARGDKVFDALARRLGTEGPDVLYEIIQARGKAASAMRATELLRDPEIAANASPALRIAFALRDAPCDKKLDLLDRAVEDGDERALAALEGIVMPCFTTSRTVSEATRKLKRRLKKR